MKILSRLLLVTMIFTLGTTVMAEGFKMDKVTVAAKYIEDEDPELRSWLYFNSNANYDWMRMNLQGKFFFEDLSENWVDYSRDGMGDLYSGVKANFRFPELSKGLDASLGYKWNHNFNVSLWGLGYGLNPVKNLSLGLRYDGAHREDISDDKNEGSTVDENGNPLPNEEDHDGDMDRRQLEFYLNFSPKNWGYALDVKQIDRDFTNPQAGNEPGKNYTYDYSSLAYIYDQKLTWQATTKLALGLRSVTGTTDYEDPGKLDGESQKWVLDGTYVLNKNWTYTSAYSISEYEGYDGTSDSNSLSFKAKYKSDGNWWLAGKLYLYDLDWDATYQNNYNNKNDKDADYNPRTQQVAAVEFEQKLDAYAYNLEVFVKNYDYETKNAISNWQDRTDVGLIGTIAWDWINLRWSFRAAPWGDLTTRKANYELKATYKF